jgi:hypothetical protein
MCRFGRLAHQAAHNQWRASCAVGEASWPAQLLQRPGIRKDGVPGIRKDGIPGIRKDGIPGIIGKDGVPGIGKDGVPGMRIEYLG